jgi:SAM-dependent methyltransferase
LQLRADQVGVRVVADGYEKLIGSSPNRRERRRIAAALKDGATVGEELLTIGRSPQYRERIAADLAHLDKVSDDEFMERSYERLFQRKPDPGGAAFFGGQLADGAPRAQLVDAWAGSDEHVNRVVAEVYPLEDLRSRHPERYQDAPDTSGSSTVPCFVADGDEAFAWIGSKIDEHGYYDRPGIWGYSLNADKRVMADVLANFEPAVALDLGCSNGTVMKCLFDLGVKSEGIELSTAAVRQAFPEIRANIHVGSVTEMPGTHSYDLIFGLDIFEHVTPGDLGQIVEAIYERLEPGGYAFANIPAYGEDEVFGEVFELYVEGWSDSAERGEPFSLLPTDEAGFPLHGHLIWASTVWWQQQFERVGFVRQPTIERAVHGRYAEYFRGASPSRLAFYVFAKEPSESSVSAIAERIAANTAPLPT